MVDFTGRAARAAAGLLEDGETILAGVNVFPSPLSIGAGAVGGALAGGAPGAAVGMAWDRRPEEAESFGVRPLPGLAARAPFEPGIPPAGGLVGVSPRRVLAWSISQMGRAKDLTHEVSIHDIDHVVWQEVEAGFRKGRPPSLLLWVGLRDSVWAMAAVAAGASGRHARACIAALAGLRPGLVEEFTP